MARKKKEEQVEQVESEVVSNETVETPDVKLAENEPTAPSKVVRRRKGVIRGKFIY